MLREIRDLGFEYAELSHGIRISLLPGILDAVSAGEIKISSVHNFCPLPMGVNYAAPNLFKFTSLDKRERENAFRHTVRSIEIAAKLKAPVVVLHMGCVDMKDSTDMMLDLVQEGKKDTASYADLCESITQQRERKKADHVRLAYEILDKLAEQAEKYGVTLGIENRESLREIPFEVDYPELMAKFNRPGVSYWHDCGHAQIKENLGFVHHAIFLEAMAPRLAGMHVHDVGFPGRDHCYPGSGMIDFAALKPMLKPGLLKVLELSPGLKTEEVQRGAEYIFRVWGKE